jgi:hypothetical protein
VLLGRFLVGLVEPKPKKARAPRRKRVAAAGITEQTLAALRVEAPQLVPRLSSALYWTLLTHGEPDDVPRYQRVFGNPPRIPPLPRRTSGTSRPARR